MNGFRIRKSTIGVLALSLWAGAIGNVAPTYAVPPSQFADVAFEKVWTRTDLPVQRLTVKRSYYWGPVANTGALMEDYAEGPGGKHMVQYFDKSRMEINDPNGDKNNPFYVTNGLLSRELISGYMQMGKDKFELRWPAYIAVAGDTNTPFGTAVTYASFRAAIERTDEKALGRVVISLISWNGALDFVHGGAPYIGYDKFNVKNAYYEEVTKHNIPDVFWNFLNAAGPIVVDGKPVNGRLSDPYFYVTGYPISDAYWTTAIIGGKPPVEVLVQAYERRMLTYVPSAPAGFKVQMGNVGQHYYDWRYKGAGKSPALAGNCTQGTPVLGFGKLYNDNPLVKIRLGCQQGPEIRVTLTRQRFDNGEIIGIVGYDFYSGRNYENVYVLFKDGTARTFPFIDVPPGPPPPTPPALPSGPYPPTVPTGNFAKILSANPVVRDQLGNSTGQVETLVVDQNGSGGGVMQNFDGGLMVYPNFTEKKIYVLYNTSGYAYEHRSPHLTLTQIDRWAVYDDAFQP